jgi:hypothetical protein
MKIGIEKLKSFHKERKQELNKEFKIDDLFGKIFGIERVHILKRSDSL